MIEVTVYNDREGNTLTVWFGNPSDEQVAEETGEEIEFHPAYGRRGASRV